MSDIRSYRPAALIAAGLLLVSLHAHAEEVDIPAMAHTATTDGMGRSQPATEAQMALRVATEPEAKRLVLLSALCLAYLGRSGPIVRN